jgi:hypothetical protein
MAQGKPAIRETKRRRPPEGGRYEAEKQIRSESIRKRLYCTVCQKRVKNRG